MVFPMRVELLFLVVLVLLQSVRAQQGASPQEPDRNVQIEFSLTPEGQPCSAMIMTCGLPLDPRRIKHPEQRYSVTEHLAPPSERGAPSSERPEGQLGDCLHWSRYQYEHLAILKDANECAMHAPYTLITWNDRSASCSPIKIRPETICARQVGSIEQNDETVATELAKVAKAMEGATFADDNDKQLKELLTGNARRLRRILQEPPTRFATVPSNPGRTAQIELSLSSEGEMCAAKVVECGPAVDEKRAGVKEQLYSIVEHLAQEDERGARKSHRSLRPGRSPCTTSYRDDYEHLTIESSARCDGADRGTTIEWKGRGPNCAPIRMSPDTICGRPTGVLEEKQIDVARELASIAISLKDRSKSYKTDAKVQEMLSSYAEQLWHARKMLKTE